MGFALLGDLHGASALPIGPSAAHHKMTRAAITIHHELAQWKCDFLLSHRLPGRVTLRCGSVLNITDLPGLAAPLAAQQLEIHSSLLVFFRFLRLRGFGEGCAGEGRSPGPGKPSFNHCSYDALGA